MSEPSISLVRLDVVPAPVPVTIAGAVRGWLLERGIVAASDRADPLWRPSDWKPGPGARSAVADGSWFAAFPGTANNGVDIAARRGCYHPVESDELPLCTRCSAAAPWAYRDGYGEWLGRWLDQGAEPAFTCDGCGRAAPAGDWAGEFSVMAGAPAITFLNWPDLDARFIAGTRVRLGGRTAVVRSHW